MNIYKGELIIKNEDAWLEHLQNVKENNGTIEDAVTFDFVFGMSPCDTD